MSFELPGYWLSEKVSENVVFWVYRGQRLQDGKTVLIKVLSQPYPKIKSLAPLWQEFEILRLLDFPGVENAIALENHQQWWMIVLDDFGGYPLDKLGLAGCMEPEEFLNLALQLAGILQEIHDRQVIHKHISPSNISYHLSTREAQLSNFGYASLVAKEKVPLKSAYQLAGFLAYISPEMTGRMNRSVDYRTDYYSLGASLYELLTGTPPFGGESPLDLIHAHLAVPPDPPASRIEPWPASPAAFQMLSAILLKLLAKNPEERYQTHAALQADLLLCQSVLLNPPSEGRAVAGFVPGMADHLADLNISQTVIGRERETEALLQAFLRAAGGPAELVLVSGEAGVGKTILVDQLIDPAAERMGYFLSAKFDQVPHQNVYQTLTELLEEFCELVLSEPAAAYKEWRVRIEAAVGSLGELLTDLCPKLKLVIGPQPPVEPVDEELKRHRFHQVVIRFLGAICQPDHPLVIFLDDLQWIKRDSLLLWQSILSTPALQNLLVVGAYRDNEVGPGHLLHELVYDLKAMEGRLTQVSLQNLDWLSIQKLIAAALASDPAEISELANLVYLRTEGNPYFSNEILKSLYKDQLLSFDLSEQKWRWDTNRIEDYEVASNVIDLFVHEIAHLDEDTQKTLQYAACIGRRFDTATLLAILGLDNAELLAYGLWQAMMEGLIRPLDENYRFLAGENLEASSAEIDEILPSLADLLQEEILFEFQHDRVQQAARAMLDEREFRKISMQTGSMLLEKAESTGQEAVQENLMVIVNHLNASRALIEEPAEAIKIAQLNLMASNQARAVAAFEAASNYLSTGIELLPDNSWHDQYTLTFELFTAGAEVALLNGDLEQAEALAQAAETNARTTLEKARVMKIRMDIYMIQTRLEEVFELGIAVIKMLGFDLELNEQLVLVPEQAIQLPAMTEPRALEVSKLDELMISSGYASNDPRLPQVVNFYIDLFSRFGNPPTASYIYVSYAVILQLNRFEQIEQGCHLGKMALELAERGGPSKTLYAVRYVYFGFVHHWWRPARECIEPLYESFQPAIDSGNLKYSISLQDLAAEVSLFVGTKLEQVRSLQSEALRRLGFLKNVEYTQRLRMWSQVAVNLMGESDPPQEINGDLFDQEEARQLIDGGQNFQYMFYLYTARAFLTFLFRDPQQALAASIAAEPLKSSAQNYLIYPIHLYLYSLALMSASLDAGSLAERLEKVEENLRLIRLWAGRVPENFLHQLELVEAEQARCLGRFEVAAERYEQAIQDARRNGYIHECALAAELAAEFHQAQGDHHTAVDHLFTAYYSYLAWGAKAKVKDLEKRYPEWLPAARENKMLNFHPDTEVRTPEELVSSIDLNSILRASLELAQETDLAELLRKLVSILIKNAGAQNASLVLRLDERWFLEIQGSTDPEQNFVLLSIPLEDQAAQYGEPLVPVSIIHYVINSEVDLVLADAMASPQFSQDPYIQSRRPKSILCAPLLNQGVLSGVIYLENNLAAGVFTSDRLEIVQLISGQAAVSIEKAKLYENLEALVEERTGELSEANRKLKEEIDERIRAEEALRHSEERFRTALENLLDGFAILSTIRNSEGRVIDFRYEYMNTAGRRMFQDPDTPFLGRTILELAPEFTGSELIQAGAHLVETGQPMILLDYPLLENLDGSNPDMAVDLQAFKLGEDRIAVTWRDVTERVRQQRALREYELALQKSEALYRAVVNTQTEFVCRYLPDTTLTFVNEAYSRFAGIKAAELVGQSLLISIPASHHETIRDIIRGMVENPRVYEFEQQMASPEGELRWQRWVHSPIQESGKVIEFQAAGFDITERKKMEQMLQENEEKFRTLFENIPDAVILSIQPGKVLIANPAASAILGWSAEELAQLGRGDIFDLEDPRLAAGLEERQRTGRVQGWELTLIRKGGEKFLAEVDSVLLPGQTDRAIIILRDITARKQAEEALRYNEALLRKVLEILPVGVWIMDKTTRINSANPEGLRIWGGAKYVDSQEYGEYKAWRINTGERVKADEWAGGLAVTQGQMTLNEELEIEAFDGERRIILNSAIPLVTEEDGLIGAIVVNQDITKRKQNEKELQKAHDQLATLLNISRSIVSTLDLDLLLNLIIEQLGTVLPYTGAAILIPDGNFLEFRIIRGPEVLHGLSQYKIPINEPTLIEPLLKEQEAFHIQDLQAEKSLLNKIQDTIKLEYDEIAFLRSWLGIPLFAKEVLIGIMVLTHSQPDYYTEPDRILARAYANQVAIAIHNAQLYEKEHEIAALEERNRLARELHDSVAQALYSISLFTDATRMALETNKLGVVKAHLEELVGLSREAMSNMRLMIYEMRPPLLEKAGLAASLQSRLDAVETRAGFQTSFRMEGEVLLSQEQENELYRIAQEALNNVLKHARADRVEVQLIRMAGKFKMVIEDNGVGFDFDTAKQAGGQGLRNIQERAEGIGAACWIESAEGQGTKITIEVNE
jgi:PAS domain S-box-containing protein